MSDEEMESLESDFAARLRDKEVEFEELKAEHDRRVIELLEHNNALLERARKAEAAARACCADRRSYSRSSDDDSLRKRKQRRISP